MFTQILSAKLNSYSKIEFVSSEVITFCKSINLLVLILLNSTPNVDLISFIDQFEASSFPEEPNERNVKTKGQFVSNLNVNEVKKINKTV